VVDYIHLNPARAGIVTPDQLTEFKPSSLGDFLTGSRPRWLLADEFLHTAGLMESPEAWSTYLRNLNLLASNPAGDERMTRGALSAGWAIGTNGWRQALAREHAQTRLAPEWAPDELNSFRQDLWQSELEAGLVEAGRTLSEATTTPNLVAWKIDLALRLRRISAAPYRWIAATLNMGAASSVRAEISRSAQRPAG
jgi:hypothetical protein